MNSTDISSNDTDIPVQELPTWTPVAIIEIPLTLIGTATNGLALTTLISHPHLWTPFNIYLINLYTANLGFIVFRNPLNIINTIFATWPTSFPACSLLMYATYVFSGALMNTHALITLDRIWAVTWPFSYRSHVGIKRSLVLCAGVWLYVHAIFLPGFVADRLYYHFPPNTAPCFINSGPPPQHVWVSCMQFIVFATAQCVIVGAYPYIWWKRRQRRKVRFVQASSQASTAKVPTSDKRDEGTIVVAVPVSHQVERKTATTRAELRKLAETTGFRIFTMMTVSKTLCYTPILVLYSSLTLNTYILNSPAFFQVASLLPDFELMLDPVWFMITIQEIRQAVCRVFRCR